MKTTLSPSIIKRAKTEALAYIENMFRVCYHDCSDSGDDADRHLARFDGIVDDAITMEGFIRGHLLAEYAAQWKAFVEEDSYLQEQTDEDKQNPGVCELPIPYDTFKHLL